LYPPLRGVLRSGGGCMLLTRPEPPPPGPSGHPPSPGSFGGTSPPRWGAWEGARFVCGEMHPQPTYVLPVFEAQKELAPTCKNKPLEKKWAPDWVRCGKTFVELNAVREIFPEHRAQVLNHLTITGLHLGLLVSRGHYPNDKTGRIIRWFSSVQFRGFRG